MSALIVNASRLGAEVDAAAEIARLTRELEEAREEITRLRAQREADLRAAYRAGAEWTLDRIDEQTARARRAIAKDMEVSDGE
ncbi:MAG TPA: hypothetical protein VIK91_19395 [Nannocystis sp.]